VISPVKGALNDKEIGSILQVEKALLRGSSEFRKTVPRKDMRVARSGQLLPGVNFVAETKPNAKQGLFASEFTKDPLAASESDQVSYHETETVSPQHKASANGVNDQAPSTIASMPLLHLAGGTIA